MRRADRTRQRPRPLPARVGFAEAHPVQPGAPQLNKVVEQRDFGANLAREIARADLRLKVSEYLVIWVGTTVGLPS